MRLTDRNPSARGTFQFWRLLPEGAGVEPLARVKNQIQSGWAFAAAKLFGFGAKGYRIQAMYLEYENMPDPDDPITIPTYAADEGIDYYNDLSLSATKDFLRVPLVTDPKLGIATGFEAYFSEDDETGNRLTFFAMSQGTEGTHGKAYGEGSNSKLYGAALVATPDFSDRSQDIIIARTYVLTADQVPAETPGRIGASWDLDFVF